MCVGGESAALDSVALVRCSPDIRVAHPTPPLTLVQHELGDIETGRAACSSGDAAMADYLSERRARVLPHSPAHECSRLLTVLTGFAYAAPPPRSRSLREGRVASRSAKALPQVRSPTPPPSRPRPPPLSFRHALTAPPLAPCLSEWMRARTLGSLPSPPPRPRDAALLPRRLRLWLGYERRVQVAGETQSVTARRAGGDALHQDSTCGNGNSYCVV